MRYESAAKSALSADRRRRKKRVVDIKIKSWNSNTDNARLDLSDYPESQSKLIDVGEVADAIKAGLHGPYGGLVTTLSSSFVGAKNDVLESLADYFATLNPAFDREAWLDRCGYKKFTDS